jgi:hypothetical protein
VSKISKIYEKLMAGQSDGNFTFDDLQYLLQKLGYDIRTTKGSHVIAQKGRAFTTSRRKRARRSPIRWPK